MKLFGRFSSVMKRDVIRASKCVVGICRWTFVDSMRTHMSIQLKKETLFLVSAMSRDLRNRDQDSVATIKDQFLSACTIYYTHQHVVFERVWLEGSFDA